MQKKKKKADKNKHIKNKKIYKFF